MSVDPGTQPSTGTPASAASRLTSVRATLILFGILAVVYLATANYDGRIPINDAINVDLPAWEIAKHHTLALSYGDYYGTFEHFIYNGKTHSDRFPGPILLAVPFYFFGPGHFSAVPGAMMAALTTAAAMAVLHRSMVKIVAPATALGAVVVLAFATGVWTVAAHDPWTHGPTLLGLAIGLWGISSGRFLAAGLGYGLAVLSRPHTVVIGVIAGGWEWYRERKLEPLVRILAGMAVGVAVLLVYTHLNSGQWNPLQGTYNGRSTAVQNSLASPPVDSWASRWGGAFFSVQRGLLPLSPFLLLLLPGLRRAWRGAPDWVRSAAVGGAVYLLAQLLGNTYKGGGGFFGYRIQLEFVLLVTPLLAISWDRWNARAPWRQVAFLVLLAPAVWWHALAAGWWEVVVRDVATGRRWDVTVVLDDAGAAGAIVAALFAAAVVVLLLGLSRIEGARTAPPLWDAELVAAEAAGGSAPVDQPAAEDGGDAAPRT